MNIKHTQNCTAILLNPGDLNVNDLNLEMEGYGQIKAYAKSKLANILFTKELDRRYKGIESFIYLLVMQFKYFSGVLKDHLCQKNNDKGQWRNKKNRQTCVEEDCS